MLKKKEKKKKRAKYSVLIKGVLTVSYQCDNYALNLTILARVGKAQLMCTGIVVANGTRTVHALIRESI